MHRAHLLGEARMERVRRRYGSADYRAAQGVMRDVLVRLVNERYDDALSALECPVELVWGDDDTDVPVQSARALAAAIPHAQLTVCPGAGHLLPLTAPSELRAAVERALARS
jgi:pimeloyl-ACP methyl ester carboxylesterase